MGKEEHSRGTRWGPSQRWKKYFNSEQLTSSGWTHTNAIKTSKAPTLNVEPFQESGCAAFQVCVRAGVRVSRVNCSLEWAVAFWQTCPVKHNRLSCRRTPVSELQTPPCSLIKEDGGAESLWRGCRLVLSRIIGHHDHPTLVRSPWFKFNACQQGFSTVLPGSLPNDYLIKVLTNNGALLSGLWGSAVPGIFEYKRFSGRWQRRRHHPASPVQPGDDQSSSRRIVAAP